MSDYFNVYFSFIYFFFVFCFILPPRELAAAGLTVQNLFASYLGSEEIDFVEYHLKRTTITLAIHSCFLILYYLGLAISNHGLLQPSTLSPFGMLFALLCIGSFTTGLLICLLWRVNNWKYHPLTQDLLKYDATWRSVASRINIEFRRLEKFCSISGGTSVYVTDSWIIKCSTYKVYIAQQTDAHLSVIQSEEFVYNQETDQGAQFLKIKVMTIPPHEESFLLNLNSMEYTDLKDRLTSPIRQARNVVIQQSLSDRFLEAFKEQVNVNGTFQIPNISNQDIENCIGCMAVRANIKLSKQCDTLSSGECQQCYCRPMWCLDCMGKWFASRQNQQEAEGWMSSRAPCPTCRAKFCMIDVFKI